jgi:hypothetical protein
MTSKRAPSFLMLVRADNCMSVELLQGWDRRASASSRRSPCRHLPQPRKVSPSATRPREGSPPVAQHMLQNKMSLLACNTGGGAEHRCFSLFPSISFQLHFLSCSYVSELLYIRVSNAVKSECWVKFWSPEREVCRAPGFGVLEFW